MNETPELVAPVGVTLEHVERRSAGRKEDNIAGFRGRTRAFDCIRQGAGDFTSRCFAPIIGDSVRHFTEKNRGMRFFLHQTAQRLEIETLVFSARDQNHRFGLRLQRFFRRIQVRRFGIVYVIDPGDRPDEFTAVGRWFIRTQRCRHLLEGQSAEVTDRERRHQIFDVVRAAQFDISQPQYRSCLETNRSISQTKIRAIVVGAEGQTPRFDRR